MGDQLFKNKYRIKSIRLKDWDYSSNGAYYITICTKNRGCLFGKIINGKMILNNIGKIIKQCWYDLPNHYENCTLDEFVIMPDHVHGLFEMIRGFKTFSSRKINKIQNSFHFQWQRDYFEHIIRNENELNIKRKNIINNPSEWEVNQT